MVAIKFISQDLKSKEKVSSTTVYFDEMDEIVLELLYYNRKKLENAMPNNRILTLIKQEEENK